MKNLLISLLIGVAIGVAGAKKLIKPEIVTKTEIKEVVRTDVQTKERIVRQKDGSEIIDRVVTDHTTSSKDSYIVTVAEKRLWNIQLFGGLAMDNKNMIYGLSIQKQYIGSLSLGVFFTTSKELGFSVGYSF